jgi:hypothetical protein
MAFAEQSPSGLEPWELAFAKPSVPQVSALGQELWVTGWRSRWP